jgi:hypothetical protein
MHCINTSHPQYKDLLNQTGLHPDVLKAKISLWMSNNNTDMFPTLTELTLSGIKPSEKTDQPFQEFADDTVGVEEYISPTAQDESLIDNIFDTTKASWDHTTDRDQVAVIEDALLRTMMFNPKLKISAENKRKLDALSLVVGKQEAYRDYFEQNETVRPAKVVLEKLVDRYSVEDELAPNTLESPELMSEEDVLRDIQELVKAENSERAINQIVKLSTQLGIPVEIISKSDLGPRFGINEDTGKVKSFYKSGTVYLVNGAFDANVVFHEFAHPIIKALAKSNPQLFANLYSELMATKEGELIFNTISGESSDYVPNSTEFMEEVIVRALENKFAVPKSWMQKLLFEIKQFLRKAFGKKINISKLQETTSISEFFNMINEGGEFILDTDFLNEDDVIMFSREYDAEVKQLAKDSAEVTQKIINEFYDIAKKQLSNFTRENDIFKLLKDDLGDENFNGELQKLVKILDVLSTNSKKPNLPLTLIQQTGITQNDLTEFNNRLNSFVNGFVQAALVFDKFEAKIDDLVANGVTDNTDLDALHALDTYVSHWRDYINKLTNGSRIDYFTAMTAPESYTSINNPLGKRLADMQQKLNSMTAKLDELKINAVIDVLYDNLIKIYNPIKQDFLDQMDTLKKANQMVEYNRLHEEYYGLTVEELNELKTLKAKQFPDVNTEVPRMEFLELKSLSGKDISKEQIKYTMQNRLGDSSWMNGMIESHLMNQDIIVQGFSSYVNEVLQEVNANTNAKETKFLQNLQPLLKKAGFDTHIFGEQALGEAIQQTNRSFEIVNNEVQEFEEYAFISNFNGHELAMAKLTLAVDKARKQYQAYGKEEHLKALQLAEFALEDFLNDYMTRDNIPEYYEHDKMFRTPEGVEARLRRDALFEEMRLLKDNLNADPGNYALSDAMQKIWYDYQQLQNIYDRDGKLKTGMDLAVAKVLTEYAKLTKDFHTYEEVEGEFERAQEAYEDYLINVKNLVRNSPAFKAEVDKWIVNNTTVQLDESYFEYRSGLLDEKKQILEPLTAVNNSIVDVTPLYDEIYTILKANKDTTGQYDGTLLSENEQIRITELHEQIVEAQRQLFTLSGLTKEESSRLNDLIDYYAYYNAFRTQADQDEYNDYMDRYKRGLMAFGITPMQVERVKAIDAELRSITSTEATNVYVNTFMSLIDQVQDSHDLLSKFIYDNFEGLDIDGGDVIDQSHFSKVLDDVSFVNKLIAVNPAFGKWFYNNHYADMGVERDSQNNIIGEIDVFRKSAAWQYTKPTDKKYYKKKNVYSKATGALIGYIEVDGVPRVPNITYMKRTVKPQYQTVLVERDYIDQNGKLVLANIDNRGQFLPRENGKDATYINGDYKLMFSKNRDLFNLMLYVKNQFLDNQKGLDNAQKRYLLYPALRKSSLEDKTSRGYLRRRVQSFLNVWRNQPDDFELGIAAGDPETDLYNTQSRPISGNYRLPKNEVSRNIIKSMGIQLYSIEYYKALRKRNSFANMLKSTVEDLTIPSTVLSLKNRLKNTLRFTKKTDVERTNRLNKIISIIDKQFKGKQIETNRSSTVKTADLVLRKMQGLLSRAAFALNPQASLTNYFGGKIMLTLKSVDKRLFTPVSLAASQAIASSTVAKLVTDSFTNKQKNLQLQLLDIMDGIPDREKKDVGDYGSKTVAQSVFKGEHLFFDRKMLQESVAVHAFYALLHNHSFKLNGKKTPLYNAVELVNGRIETKAGVPAEYSISYDSDGNVIFGEQIKKLMNMHQGVLLKTVGQANEFSEPDVYRHILGRYAFALLKFFPSMFQDRYAFSTKRKGALRSFKNALTGKADKRVNLYLGRAETGSVIGAIEALKQIFTGKFNTLDYNAKIGLLHTTAGIAAKILLMAIVGGIMFNDDDDDDFTTSYDPDDKHRFNKLDNSTGLPNLPWIHSRYTERAGRRFDSEDYWDLQNLRLALRVQREVETFEPTDAFKTIRNIVTLKSPLGEGNLTTMVDLTTQLYNTATGQEEVYTRAAGPYYGQQKNDNKYLNSIMKFYGLTGKMADPALAIERENSGRY